MGNKGGRKPKKGKSATSAPNAPPVDSAVTSEPERQIEEEVRFRLHQQTADRKTSSRPESPSGSEPRNDEPSIPTTPPVAEVSEPIVKPDEQPEAEERAAPAASPPEGEDITTSLSNVNLESEGGDIGMPQEEVVPAEESVHVPKPEELESERNVSAPELSQDEPLAGDLGEPDAAAEPTTVDDLRSEPSPAQSFKSVELEPTPEPADTAAVPEVQTTSTHTNFDDLQEFDEVDIGAGTEPSQTAAVRRSSESDRPVEPESADTSSTTTRPASDLDPAPAPAEITHERESAEQPVSSSHDDIGTGVEQATDVHPIATTSTTPLPHESEDVNNPAADQTSLEAVPDVHIDSGTPVSSRSESKPPSALGPAFESPSSIAHRRQLPPLSVNSTPSSHTSTPTAAADAPQISPMLRSTSMSSSRVGIISPRSIKGPAFRSIDAVHTDDEYDSDDGMEDMPLEGAPFESIPLDGDAEVTTSLSRTGSIGSRHSHSRQHSRQPSKESNVAHASLTNGHARVDSHGIPISRPRTPTSRVVTPRESTSDLHSPRGGASPKVNPVPANANNQPSQALGVKGVNAFEKFVSRTRPAHLPPKDKSEDMEHLHQWESMMAQAKAHDAEERKKQQQRQQQREKRLMDVTPRWEALLNSKDFSPAKVRANPSNRKLWFDGCPPRLRGKAWQLAIGNPLTLHKDAYKVYLKRSQRALEHGRFPADILEQLEADLDHTLNTLHIFQRGSPMRDELKELICAWVVYRSDEALGYAPYINLLAAMFLLVLPADQAFFSLCNFLSRPVMRAFYADTRDEIAAFYRVFENLQADTFPRIFANCKNLGLSLPESYFRSVLVEQVPFECALRLWDQIVLDGDGYIFRANLAIFGFLEPRLYYPDRDEIRSVLEGHNRASMLIQERERERAKLRGEVYDHHVDGSLSVFGLTEEPLFEWLENDRWQESRFERLVVRELPD